jgi:hypothetical protein
VKRETSVRRVVQENLVLMVFKDSLVLPERREDPVSRVLMAFLVILV